jgi:hypothetical protein
MVAHSEVSVTGSLRRMSQPKVLSIVGPGRSGTTILASVLGEGEGVVSVGELRWLWRRGLLERRTSGCGHPPDECPVWSGIVPKVLAETSATAAEMAAAQDELSSRRHRLRAIRSASGGEGDWPALARVRAVTGRLISAIAQGTGARVIVDSSKRAQDAAVMAAVDGIDHYVLHMVRDPGAVAYSWQRRDKTIRLASGTRSMATRRLLPSVARWEENCLSAEVLRRHVRPDRWMFLRYEDFATDPRAAVADILAFLGETPAPPFTEGNTVVLGVNHTVAGNPNRFRTGPVTIALDDEWCTRMPWYRQRAVRALTWPFLLRYHYEPNGRKPAGRGV